MKLGLKMERKDDLEKQDQASIDLAGVGIVIWDFHLS